MMKKFILFCISYLIILTGCSSIPGPVEESYLLDKTPAESEKINTLEQKIIEKNKERQTVEKRLKEISPLAPQTEEELKLLKKENAALKEMVNFYSQNKDAVNLEKKNKELKENEELIEQKTNLFNYQKAETEMTQANLDLKSAELNLLVAELNYEKSKIAARNREKQGDPGNQGGGNFFTNLFSKPDPDDKYGYKKYENYYKKQQEELTKAEKKFKESEKKFLEAKAAFDSKNLNK